MRSGRSEQATAAAPDVRSGMSRLAFITGSLLWITVFVVLLLPQRDGIQNSDPVQAGGDLSAAVVDPDSSVGGSVSTGDETPIADPVIASTRTVKIGFPTRQLPEFELQECLGGVVTRESLLGKRWLANFVFTRCAGPCPLMTRDISELHRQVADANPDFQFVTFSVDPDHDRPEVLKQYAETFQADHDRWKFLSGEEEAMHDLIRRGFALYVAPNLGENRKPGFEVAHSNRAVLVNEEGFPVATYLMTVPEDVVKLRRVIDGRDEFPEAGPLLQDEATGENPPIQFNLLPATGDGGSQDSAEPAVPDSEGEDSNERDSSQDSNATGEDSAPVTEKEAAQSATGSGTQGPSLSTFPDRYLLTGLLVGQTDEQDSVPDAAGDQDAAAGEGLSATADPSDGRSVAEAAADGEVDPEGVAEFAGSEAAADDHSGAALVTETGADRNRKIDQTLPDWAGVLPTLNALLNSCCIALLSLGLMAIRRSEKQQHQKLMISAFVVSVVFLISYLTYHEMLFRYTGERGRAFVGSALAKWLYYAILIPHVILAAAVPVLALRVFWLAWKQQWEKHRSLARITFPIWMFVSISGVLIYMMLYHWPWSTIAPAAGPEASALRVHFDWQLPSQVERQTLRV